jgi:hypothetical protein
MNKLYILIASFLIVINAYSQNNVSNFIFTSDVHYGKTKVHFRGKDSVPAYLVNASMVEQINKMTKLKLPADNGVGADDAIKSIEAVIITGDIANREEFDKDDNRQVQSATDSWKQFTMDYITDLTLKNREGKPAPLWLTAGNHDVSNAIGFHRKMIPDADATAYIGIYNMEMKPQIPLTNETFNYEKDKIHYSKSMSGVHFQFINLWPDSAERIWMAKDLDTVALTTPVLIFTHSSPSVEARFFINPNGDHSINKTDKFENLLSETFKDGNSTKDTAKIEEAALVDFLKKHKNIKAYFHGHNNHTEYYAWTDVDYKMFLPTVRVDSPMKGNVSSKDETKLSYEIISIDPDKKSLTVRECLWNTDPSNANAPIKWGQMTTVPLK